MKKARHEYLPPDSPERHAPQPEQVMNRPVPKLRPKKVSPIEPPSMDFAPFAKLDIIHRISGDREFAPVP